MYFWLECDNGVTANGVACHWKLTLKHKYKCWMPRKQRITPALQSLKDAMDKARAKRKRKEEEGEGEEMEVDQGAESLSGLATPLLEQLTKEISSMGVKRK